MQEFIMPKRLKVPASVGIDNKRNRTVDEEMEKSKVTNFVDNQEHINRLLARGITNLFPVQVKSYSSILKGRDVIGRARTGTGKTLAFSLPTIARLGDKMQKHPRMLVILPTRELAIQVQEEIGFLVSYFDPKTQGYEEKDLRKGNKGAFNETLAIFCCYGGSSYEPLLRQVQKGIDILVGTPGRLVDALDRNIISFHEMQVVVIDEADKLLEMGFKTEVDRLLNEVADNSHKNQYLLFSATLPAWVEEITTRLMDNPKTVDVVQGTDGCRTAANIRHLAIQVGFQERPKMLKNVINLYAGMTGKVVIFVDKKSVANSIALDSELAQMSQVLHGDIVQTQREAALKGFREGRFRCLICTDVAARGIHVDDISLVIQMTLPDSPDTFIHRSGRTGRAGNSGTSIIMHSMHELDQVRRIEKEAGFIFEKVGAPQKSELIKSNAQFLVDGMIKQDSNQKFKDKFEKNLERLHDSAKELLTSVDGDAVKAVSRCIYALMGENDANDDSVGLLSGRGGCKAYILEMNDCEVRSKSFIFSVIKRYFGEEMGEHLNNMNLTANHKGACFEVPTAMIPAFERGIEQIEHSNTNFTIEELVKLPELEETQSNNRSRGGNGNSNGGGRNFRGGGGGGFRGGNRGRGGNRNFSSYGSPNSGNSPRGGGFNQRGGNWGARGAVRS